MQFFFFSLPTPSSSPQAFPLGNSRAFCPSKCSPLTSISLIDSSHSDFTSPSLHSRPFQNMSVATRKKGMHNLQFSLHFLLSISSLLRCHPTHPSLLTFAYLYFLPAPLFLQLSIFPSPLRHPISNQIDYLGFAMSDTGFDVHLANVRDLRNDSRPAPIRHPTVLPRQHRSLLAHESCEAA